MAGTTAYRLPPGPRSPMWLNGLMFLVAQRPMARMLQRCYGDAWRLRIPTMGTTVIVANPELVKTVFTARPDVLHAGENPLGAMFGPGSLFSMDGERHLAERKLLLAPFHGDRMRAYEAIVEEEARREFASWEDDAEFATLPSFNRITLRVILRAVFGAEGRQLRELETLLPRMTRIGQKLVAFPPLRRDLGRLTPGGRYRPMRERYDAIVDGLIDQRLADPALDERIDVLALLVRATATDDGQVRRRDLADELLTLLLAGHETTASSLAWAVERLRRHPDVLRRLEDEARGDDAAYRAATINEVHRTRPVIAGTMRLVKQPFELGPWRLPPGVTVIANGVTMHDDERLHPRADTFDPERYVGRKPDTYAWIPFGGGVRRCIGAAFATMEMDVVLRTLLREFALQPTTDAPERQRFRGVATAPSKRGRAVVRRRRNPLGDDDRVSRSGQVVPMHGVR